MSRFLRILVTVNSTTRAPPCKAPLHRCKTLERPHSAIRETGPLERENQPRAEAERRCPEARGRGEETGRIYLLPGGAVARWSHDPIERQLVERVAAKFLLLELVGFKEALDARALVMRDLLEFVPRIGVILG